MTTFNTSNLQKILALTPLGKIVSNKSAKVKMVKWDGRTFEEGIVTLTPKAPKKNETLRASVPVKEVQKFKNLLRSVWGSYVNIDFGVLKGKPVLYIYVE